MLSHPKAIRILQRLPQLGISRFWQLMNRFPSAIDVLHRPAAELASVMKPATLDALTIWQQQPDLHPLSRQIDLEDEWLAQQADCHLIAFDDPRYPALLKEISRPPPLLYVRGNPDCLALPQLAIVGSRTPSPTGADNALQFARFLAGNGFVITSGLAKGIDGQAHSGAVSVNAQTIAVLGTGIDRVYPLQHRSLATQILANGGALISEFPPGTKAEASHFPQRNRIISGMSQGTLVVEAAVKSGSLITARMALEQNREVFAIPGSIHNPLARGCHQLIREGATLVESAADIVEQLGGLLAWHQQQSIPADALPDISPFQQQVLEQMGFDPVDMDLLIERLDCDIGTLGATLIELQLQQRVAETRDGFYRLK